MKTSIALWLFLSGILSAVPEADWTAWQWESPFEVGREGIVRLEVPPPVLDVSRPDLGDLRVLSPSSMETPYLVDQPVRHAGAVRDAAEFKVALSGRSTVIEVSSGTSAMIQSLQLVTPAREFLKSISIEARKGAGGWQTLAASEVIFRQAGGAERLRVPIPAGNWDGFRFNVDDGRSQPIPFTGVRLTVDAGNPVTVETPMVLGGREEVSGETRLTIDLGARNLDVAELRFEIPDAVFSRACTLGFSTPTPDGGTRMEIMANGVLYRVAGDRGVSAEELVIPVQRRIPARSLVATFRNGDSPPLTITGGGVRCYPTILAFHAARTGGWQLLTGNNGVKSPVYDLNPLRGTLAGAGGQHLSTGPLRAKVDFRIPPPLPGVEPSGVDIGLTKWSRRRTVNPVPSGVIQIELDALTLAACRTDLGDLRLVQNGRQIPYLIKQDGAVRELKPSIVAAEKDPKRPTVSRWVVTLPVDGLPALGLTARSTAPLFVRRVVALIERKDEFGNVWTENVGAADWEQSGGVDTPLAINLGGERMPRSFVLETDNRDNPPIPLDDVRLRFAAPTLTAKLTDAAALFLYYGNPKASAPQYDLRLVRNELMAAQAVQASLGVEEILKPDAREKRGVDAGSPWLWLALGGVVIVLLVIVAKLLPRPAAE